MNLSYKDDGCHPFIMTLIKNILAVKSLNFLYPKDILFITFINLLVPSIITLLISYSNAFYIYLIFSLYNFSAFFILSNKYLPKLLIIDLIKDEYCQISNYFYLIK